MRVRADATRQPHRDPRDFILDGWFHDLFI
jgi:hypothetical protein